MSTTETEIPRVSIDSLAQWREIKQNMMTAALQRLDERIRTGGLEGEREAMEAYVRNCVNETMEIAQLNIRVNGTNWEDLKHVDADDDMEPFDDALDTSSAALGTQRLDWERIIVDSRLTRPPQHRAQVESAVQRGLKADEEREAELERENEKKTDGEEMHVDGEGEEDVEERVRPLYALARELEQTLPVQLERVKNFPSIRQEVMGLKR